LGFIIFGLCSVSMVGFGWVGGEEWGVTIDAGLALALALPAGGGGGIAVDDDDDIEMVSAFGSDDF